MAGSPELHSSFLSKTPSSKRFRSIKRGKKRGRNSSRKEKKRMNGEILFRSFWGIAGNFYESGENLRIRGYWDGEIKEGFGGGRYESAALRKEGIT